MQGPTPVEPGEPIPRTSGRVILIGPGSRTLLFRGGDPHRPADGTWWFTPGGGADPGESSFEAARRELWEETGHSDVEWSGLVARREAVFMFLGATYLSREEFYVAHTTRLEIDPSGFTDLEADSVEEYRWLDSTAIRRLPDPVYPAELTVCLGGLAARRYPAQPWTWK
jgi:8-oxo-dGTP pyrophosphatase MutT (NUDIX family)